MASMWRLFGLFSTIIVFLLLSSCGGVSPPREGMGHLKVEWKFPGNIGCAEAGVVVVGMEVYGLDGDKEYENNFSCDYMGVTVTNFSPNRYTVILIGYGRQGEIRYYGSSDVDIDGNTYLIQLSYVLSDISLSWAFESANNTDCVQAGIFKIGIRIYNSGDTLEYENVVYCSDKGGTITGFAPRQSYRIELTGYDVSGTSLYAGSITRTVNIGDNDLGVIVLHRIYSKAIFQVGWTFGEKGLSCNEVGVVNVRIVFSAPSGSAVFLNKTVGCLPQQYMNQDLSDGVYTFVIYGIDENGNITYGSSQRNVELKKGYNDLGIVVLNRRD